MNVARLNMSHGTHEDHREVYHRVRKASDDTGRGVGIFADLQGPKIRLGLFPDGPALLMAGEQWTITPRDVPGDALIGSTTYAGLPGDEIGRAHVCTPVTNAHLVIRLLLETKKNT